MMLVYTFGDVVMCGFVALFFAAFVVSSVADAVAKWRGKKAP